jgi:hypothetical protein
MSVILVSSSQAKNALSLKHLKAHLHRNFFQSLEEQKQKVDEHIEEPVKKRGCC